MVEPMAFKTNLLSGSVAVAGKIEDYNIYRNKISAFAKNLFENAPEPIPVIDTLIKLVEDKNPKFSHPVGKGASVFLAIQHFAYKTFENSIIKSINKSQK